jgi:hypothetical protein
MALLDGLDKKLAGGKRLARERQRTLAQPHYPR